MREKKGKTKIFGACMAVLLFMLCAVRGVCAEEVPEERQMPRFVDNAGLLSEEEEKELNSTLDEISERQECDVAVVTVNGLDGKTVEEYADDFYDYNGYGYGDDDSGILLLVAMDDREWHMSTYGYGITAFTDAGLAYMEDDFVSYLSDAEYMDAFTEYADLCDEFLTQAKTGEPYDTGNLPKGTVSPFWIAGDLLIGIGIALVMALIKKGNLKSVKQQTEAAAYERKGSLKLTVKEDRFVNRLVTTRKIERKKEDSGGSTVHTSSSGRSHGGRSGKF